MIFKYIWSSKGKKFMTYQCRYAMNAGVGWVPTSNRSFVTYICQPATTTQMAAGSFTKYNEITPCQALTD